jgi:hypothetical protein
MNIKNLKLEFFYLRKAFFEYHHGFKYLYNRYFLAPKILKGNKVLEKPINNENLSLHILTHHQGLIMTLWSLVGFYDKSGITGKLFIHDDGTLTEKDKDIFKKFFPAVRIVAGEEIIEKESFENYPFIKKFRVEDKKNFLLKKIIDTYFLSDKEMRLIIDADLLWFRSAEELLSEMENGCQNSLMMANNNFSYVYFMDGEKLNQDLASYNSGIVLYRRDNFDVAKLENYLNKIDESKKENNHFIEQAGFAYCLKNLKKLDEKKYVIKEAVDEETVVKHYTSPRRPLFYIEGITKLKTQLTKHKNCL